MYDLFLLTVEQERAMQPRTMSATQKKIAAL